MQKGLEKLAEVRAKVIVTCTWKTRVNAFNTARIEALELENLMEVAEATAVACSDHAYGKPRCPRP